MGDLGHGFERHDGSIWHQEHEALEETIVVYVNGIEVDPSNWYYDSSSQSVIFTGNVPEEGDNIQIDYAAPATCD